MVTSCKNSPHWETVYIFWLQIDIEMQVFTDIATCEYKFVDYKGPM